ncbi:hypothetical protein [Lysobacter xanthus]
MNTRTPIRPPASPTPYTRRPDLSRQITSAHIADHVAAFQAAGGTVEVLGTTPVLKRLKPDAEPAAKPAR